MLTREENLEALANINHAWAGKAMRATGTSKIIMDMDLSESPVHGCQKGSACNRHFIYRYRYGGALSTP